MVKKAKAVVIGEVTKNQDYKIKHKGKIVCNVPIKIVTKGVLYKRDFKKPLRNFKEPNIKEPKNFNETALKILNNPNVASKEKCYKHYDKNVLGNTIIEPGLADAGLLRALPKSKYGVALSVDSNPRYGKIDPTFGHEWAGILLAIISMIGLAKIQRDEKIGKVDKGKREKANQR